MSPLLAAAVKTSAYQLLKLKFLSVVPLSKDATHIYIGFGCFLLAVTVLRIPPTSFKAILPCLAASLLMEVADLRDEFVYTGELRWAASLKDVVNTNLISVLLVLLFRARGPNGSRARAQPRGR